VTYLELQEYVRERLGITSGDTSRNTQIQRVLNSEYQLACMESEATLGTAAVTFTNAVATVTLGVTVQKVKAIFTSSGRLQPISPSRYAFYAGTFTGADLPARPKYYIVIDGVTALVVRLWPVPGATDTTPIAFVVTKPTALSANGDIPSSIPEAFHHDVIAERAVEKLALAEEAIDLAREAKTIHSVGMAALMQHVRARHGELDATVEAWSDLGAPMPDVLGQGVQR
jgi:hypothetical protein